MRMSPLFLILCLALSLFAPAAASGQQPPPVSLVDAGDFDCLPVESFGLAGLRLWQPERVILDTLGSPLGFAKSQGEDDGGSYIVNRYRYQDLQLDAVRGRIDRIMTESSLLPMPSGVRVGDSLEEVARKFGRTPRDFDAEERELQIVTCPRNGKWIQEDYVTLQFDSGLHLIRITYEANRP